MKKSTYSIAASMLLVAGLSSGLALAKDEAKLNLSETISIEQALQKAEEAYPKGQVVEAELEDDRGGLWELKLVTADGATQKLYLDARTGERRSRL